MTELLAWRLFVTPAPAPSPRQPGPGTRRRLQVRHQLFSGLIARMHEPLLRKGRSAWLTASAGGSWPPGGDAACRCRRLNRLTLAQARGRPARGTRHARARGGLTSERCTFRLRIRRGRQRGALHGPRPLSRLSWTWFDAADGDRRYALHEGANQIGRNATPRCASTTPPSRVTRPNRRDARWRHARGPRQPERHLRQRGPGHVAGPAP